MTMTAKQSKTQTLTKPMKVWMLKTLKTGTITMETANEFFQMCEKLELQDSSCKCNFNVF